MSKHYALALDEGKSPTESTISFTKGPRGLSNLWRGESVAQGRKVAAIKAVSQTLSS
jgi:hypothetical protein